MRKQIRTTKSKTVVQQTAQSTEKNKSLIKSIANEKKHQKAQKNVPQIHGKDIDLMNYTDL